MGRGGGFRAKQRAEAQHREALERAWADRLWNAPDLQALVVARQAQREPFHRWLSYRQGFAPELVRRFMSDAGVRGGVILDPFSGSGTVATEVARAGRSALGVDAVGSLQFMAHARTLPADDLEAPDLAASTDLTPKAFFENAPTLRARAAGLLAASAMVDGEGHQRRDGRRFVDVLGATIAVMQEDAARDDRPVRAGFVQGDARRLPLPDASVGGVLTSPPYLSRYDYARVNDAPERLWRGRGRRAGRKRQLRASRVGPGSAHGELHPAALEAADRLHEHGRKKEAEAALSYIADMTRVVHEIARVLEPGAPMWMVVAGSEFKRTYVPCDLICAAAAEDAGLTVETIRVARLLKKTGRRLGELHDVAPREVVIVARR